MNDRSRAKIKAVNLKFACKMSKFERTAFYLIASSGHLKRHALKQEEITVILEDIIKDSMRNEVIA